jgi:hypothetical protein
MKPAGRGSQPLPVALHVNSPPVLDAGCPSRFHHRRIKSQRLYRGRIVQCVLCNLID